MNRLLAAVGIDAAQWRVLTRVLLTIDFSGLLGAYGQRAARQSALSLIFTASIYTVSGLVPAALIYLTFDNLLGATFMTTQIAFIVGASLLLHHGSAIVSPDDHEVLGLQPVSSRTYLAVRVTVLLTHTLLIAALAGYTPVAAFLIKPDVRLPGMIGAMLAVVATAITTALSLVVVYGWLLRTVGPTRLARVLSYAQMAAAFVIYGGVPFAFYLASREIGSDLSLEYSSWAPFYPGTWFGTYVDLARGQFSTVTVGLALLSIGLLGSLVWMVAGKLSLDYADRLGQLAAAPAAASGRRASRRLAFLTGEARAVTILIRAQFRYDMKFRLGVLSLVPLTVLYLYLGSNSGQLADPFLPAVGRGRSLGLIQFALLVLPLSLRRALVTSDGYRASWIFHATPADRVRLVVSSRDVVAVLFLSPYLLILAGIFTYFFGHAGHALLHTAFLGCMSYLVLQLTVLADPRLPFSVPLARETSAGVAFGLIVLALVAGMLINGLLVSFVYGSAVRIVLAFGAFAVAGVTVNRLTRGRIERVRHLHAYLG